MAEDPKELFQSLEDFANEPRESIYGGAQLASILKRMARALVYLYKNRPKLVQVRRGRDDVRGLPVQRVDLRGTSIPLKDR